MPTKNGDIGHNFNWHARAADEDHPKPLRSLKV